MSINTARTAPHTDPRSRDSSEKPPRTPRRFATALLALSLGLGLVIGTTAQSNPAAAATAPTSGFVTAPSPTLAAAPITATTPRLKISQLRMMNYYPSAAPWTSMWTNYNHATVDADFAKISQLGANAVRVVVQPTAVGWPTVSLAGAASVRDMVDTAAAHGLAVQFTLFDWFSGYNDVPHSVQWMTSLLAPYATDNRVALVEVQNEFPISNPVAVSWASSILARLPSILPGVPRTISVAGLQDAPMFTALTKAIGSSLLDVIDVHLYGSENSIIVKLAAANLVAAGRPVFVGELGQYTDVPNTSCAQNSQLSFFERAALNIARAGVSGVSPWTLNDFVPANMPTTYPAGSYEARYGLRALSGSWKSAASAVTAMNIAPTPAVELANLSASNIADLSFDGGFDCDLRTTSDNTGKDAWAVFDPADVTTSGATAGAGINGSYAGFLQGTAGNPATKIPSLMHSFPSLSARPITVTAQTRLVAGTGSTSMAVAWYGTSGAYLGQKGSVLANNANTGWQTLSLLVTPPVGAASFQLHLKSLSNSGTAYFDSVTLNN